MVLFDLGKIVQAFSLDDKERDENDEVDGLYVTIKIVVWICH